MMPPFDVTRLQPHDGDLGISSWVDCAACVNGWTTIRDREPGWFAIRAGERHEVDPVSYQHVHTECAHALRAEQHLGVLVAKR